MIVPAIGPLDAKMCLIGEVALLERLFSLVTIGEHWIYNGYKDKDGYGAFSAGKRTYKTRRVHRVSFMIFKGPIPDGYEPHHNCLIRACIRPKHLDLMTVSEHARLSGKQPKIRPPRTHCMKGHELTPENTYIFHRNGKDERSCVTCRNATAKEWQWNNAFRRVGPGRTYIPK